MFMTWWRKFWGSKQAPHTWTPWTITGEQQVFLTVFPVQCRRCTSCGLTQEISLSIDSMPCLHADEKGA